MDSEIFDFGISCEVKVVNDPITLSDLTLSANVQVEVGSSVVVSGFHPVSEEYVVARQETVIPSWLLYTSTIQM